MGMKTVGLGLSLVIAMVVTSQAADLKKGERTGKLCIACHSVVDATNKTGPSLKGIVGRAVGAAPGFTYSANMLEFAKTNPIWTEALLDAYIEKPKKLIPTGSMAFGGVPKKPDRENLIAYLKTLTP